MSGPNFSLNLYFLHKKTSMIVLEVYIRGIAGRKSKCNPPVLINLNCPCSRSISFEWMKLKVWQRDIFQRAGCVNYIKSIAQPR